MLYETLYATRYFLPRFTLYTSRYTKLPSTTVESPLQINLFLCKTNPISWIPKMNLSFVITKDYENVHLLGRRKNKAKQTQFKPNTKPIKPNTKPIKANTMPKQTQFKPNFKVKREKQKKALTV